MTPNEKACMKCLYYKACVRNSEYVPTLCDLYEEAKAYRKQSEGEWDDSIIGFCNVCKVCGAIVERSAIKNRSGKLNYCPNCGAKMKGGEDRGEDQQ